MRVLLVEDDDPVAEALVPALARHGLAVRRLPSAAGALELVGEVDVVLLDLRLPDVDGVVLCRRMREVSGDVAIIMVTALGEVHDKVVGLQAGADDYVVKPYDVDELVARIHAVHRRRTGANPVAELDGARVDFDRREVTVDGVPVLLSRKEFQVLALIFNARGAVCERETILDQVWQHAGAAENRSLDVHIANLRTKLGRSGLIETVRGVGYRLSGQPRFAG
ncbi:response regulator transcription factor [Actinokineospora bangkokensis]|uniref:Sensory transduction protein RegX3 n=1 Tax=Actinokineospora bangkokensis TaxID=1193682 RepID=A0A1Q9LT45_9PSEU|nr:response regulator transcription factor [Actinokineospora bangkokensis]OLR95198.1 DNA-binding response regulator [Actinokineospora bangkokensis]